WRFLDPALWMLHLFLSHFLVTLSSALYVDACRTATDRPWPETYRLKSGTVSRRRFTSMRYGSIGIRRAPHHAKVSGRAAAPQQPSRPNPLLERTTAISITVSLTERSAPYIRCQRSGVERH